VVGVGPSCAVPMPRSATRAAQSGGHPAEQCLLSRHKLDEVLTDVRSS
jgi:hypothetical protein